MNWPNALTMLRMALVPVFAWLYFAGEHSPALFVYLLAAATDLLDGYLARRLHQITDFGKLCDPLADKLMQCTMLFCLAFTGRVSFAILCVLAVKELYMVIGAVYMLRRHIVVYANIWGKAATFLFIFSLVLVYPWHASPLLLQVGQLLLLAALCLSLLSAAVYTVDAVKKMRHHGV